MTGKIVIRTEEAPGSALPFSQGIRKGPVLQVSGQGPVDPRTGEYVHPGDVRAQTRQVLANVAAILRAGGAGPEDLVMLRVYLTDRDLFGPMNEAYGEFLRQHIPSGEFPCRTTVFAGLPHPDMLVEIDALAVVG